MATTRHDPGRDGSEVAGGVPQPARWSSPLPARAAAAAKVSRSGLQVDGGCAYWLESRPAEGGRQVLVRWAPGTGCSDVSPPGVSVRSRAHEYGGGASWVAGGTLWYCDQDDQGIHRCEVGSAEPGPLLTPAAAGPTARRYADLRPLPGERWVVAVEEEVSPRTGAAHRLVAVSGAAEVVGLTGAGGFVAAPRPSPDGRSLAWITWRHPAMSWDASELWVAPLEADDAGRPRLGRGRRVAGGDGSSVGQPAWLADGSLLFMWDRDGWWQPYQVMGSGPPVRRCAAPAEFHAPDWVFGQATAAEAAGVGIVARMGSDGVDRLIVLDPGLDAAAREVDQPCTAIGAVAALGDSVVVLGSPPDAPAGVFFVPVVGGGEPVRVAGDLAGVPVEVRPARAITVPGPGGPVHALVHRPLAPWRGRPGPPPLVVWAHGGPTGASGAGYDPIVAFLTTRGLTVAAVDYRGSAGYGRAYRQALAGEWGTADVDDCVAVAEWLAAGGEVDGRQMAIRGTSAGGFTALAAMARSTVFAGAVGWYPVTDLEHLAAETHDFEAHYLDGLVGPLPEARSRYRERSPAWNASRIAGAVLVLQGTDDAVVPPDQARRFAEAVRAAGGRCQLHLFDGEGHGFRRSTTIEAALEAESAFYDALFTDAPGAR